MEDCQFTRLASVYDHLMRDVPYGKWVDYVERLVSLHHQVKVKRVLDLACGTGAVALRLQARGYQVVGIDSSVDMLRVARSRTSDGANRVEWMRQDAADICWNGAEFDLVICLFDSLNYVYPIDRLAKVFKNVASLLGEQGLLIFDMNTEYALQNKFFDQANTGSRDWLHYDWRSEYDEITRVCTIRMLFSETRANKPSVDFTETHRQFAYSLSEVESALAAAGLGLDATYNAYTLNPPAPLSDRLFYVASLPPRAVSA